MRPYRLSAPSSRMVEYYRVLLSLCLVGLYPWSGKCQFIHRLDFPAHDLFSGHGSLKREYNNYRKKFIKQLLTENGVGNNESHDNQDHDAAAKDERSHESHDGE